MMSSGATKSAPGLIVPRSSTSYVSPVTGLSSASISAWVSLLRGFRAGSLNSATVKRPRRVSAGLMGSRPGPKFTHMVPLKSTTSS